jgi:hypothetical protein
MQKHFRTKRYQAATADNRSEGLMGIAAAFTISGEAMWSIQVKYGRNLEETLLHTK